MSLSLADGQLSATSATILGAGTAERSVAVTLHNVAAQEQTIALTITRAGSSARTVARAKLKQYQTLYVRGLPLDPSDILAGSATGPSSVDYLVNVSHEPFSITIRDADGSPKASSSIEVEVTESHGLTRDGVVLMGLLEEIRDVLLKIA